MSAVARPMAICFLLAFSTAVAQGQPYGQPDRGQPGDEMIQAYLARVARELDARFADDLKSAADWEQARPRYHQEYLHMLGLWPLPEKNPLAVKVTGTIERDDYAVDLLHYQSRPGLYVTGNLYRPRQIAPGARLPAVFYVCGHSGMGRNGNKTAYQSHGIWFARHGYICLVVDTLQLGEIAAIHHGTYRENRWWWHSRGYTSAGVECWNGVRGIDYLTSRPDVDPQRIAVTGISGGGAATFWIAAADPRVGVAVPVSGMADLESYVANRVINGHCDCMFLYNTFQWPWTRIAGLIAPRPLLFTNSDQDPIFPMDANDRISNRLERMYSLFGAGDVVDALVSVGGHAYRQDLRQGAYRFINTHLTANPRRIDDSEVDLISGRGNEARYPIEPERLRVFPTDADIPRDQQNTTIDQHFVPLAEVPLPAAGEFVSWKARLIEKLRRESFGYFPPRVPEAKVLEAADDRTVLETEPGIRVTIRPLEVSGAARPRRIVLLVDAPSAEAAADAWKGVLADGDLGNRIEVRGVGDTRWTNRNPPNFVARSHVLLGRTVAAGRVWDVIAAARYLQARHQGELNVFVAGRGEAAVLAAYAALLEEDIAGAILLDMPAGHMAAEAPAVLNVLRTCDLPDVVGMLAPKPVRLGGDAKLSERAKALYTSAAAAVKLTEK